LVKTYYINSYSYSNRHYATLVPALNRLPPPVGGAIFAVIRRLVRNKLVFLARLSEAP
jgi:hypothetical protein